MARTKPSEQLSRAEIERFLAAAEALHKSIAGPLLAYHREHCQALPEAHGPLLKSIETVTGQKAQFIRWNGTGPAQPRRSLRAGSPRATLAPHHL
ncbi:hypothetical protein X735_05270 [Mesorhizobium sp. L2C085B000]|nr:MULTISPECIES: hypothetical protein [unclassified Mesorhizobium]ESX84295.1 hypothetical protein X756_25890 [Mesorhizobium sp. LSHC412B00]ESZ16281.1 hypothetical protein X735_05270 [Mesorhizobium sp. L2C085B000]ESZ41978.1 hypothetical protein X732_04505 [Mesorhizobium sp. L2C066B000]